MQNYSRNVYVYSYQRLSSIESRWYRRKPRVVADWENQDKWHFPPKPSRIDVMIPMFSTQSVTFWYPTSFPQFRTIVRPPNPYLPLSLTLKGRQGGDGTRAPPRPSRLTCDDFAWPSHVLPTDRQTPPAGRVAPILRWNARPIILSGDRRARRASHRASAGARSVTKTINDDAVIRRWQLQCRSFCSYRDCYLMGQIRTLSVFGVGPSTQNFS